MKLSTKTRYSLRALIAIALHQKDGPVSIHLIAEQEEISANYLVQLLSKLRKANLIKSVRGPSGGFLLTVPPEKIMVADVFRAVEEKMITVHCFSSDSEKKCHHIDTCHVFPFWEHVAQQFVDCCEKTSIADIYTGEFKRRFCH